MVWGYDCELILGLRDMGWMGLIDVRCLDCIELRVLVGFYCCVAYGNVGLV